MGKVLSQLITNKNKTKKYVYDETALMSSVQEKKQEEEIFKIKSTIMKRKLLIQN